jgi:alpha-tubulin suppressor-like RCC1 family protein
MGSLTTCADVSGTAKCWGSNLSGQLGNGAEVQLQVWVPVDVVGLGSHVTSVNVGYEHACALLDDGAVKCWGQGGMRGDHSTTSDVTESHPIDVVSLP